MQQWRNYRINEGFDDRKGVFLAIHSCETAGIEGRGDDRGGWRDLPNYSDGGGSAWVTTDGDSEGEDDFKQTVIMECLHPLLLTTESNGAYRVAGCSTDDHQLASGVDYNDTYNYWRRSPMGNWPNDYQNGCCSEDVYSDISLTLSDCTKTALEWSAEIANGDYCCGDYVYDDCDTC